MNDLNLFKKNGFLVKENLISQTKINKINKIVNEVISKEKKRKKGNGTNGTQSYDNYHFVYNSGSSKNKEILRLNNPQNRHKVFYELSRDKKTRLSNSPISDGICPLRLLLSSLRYFKLSRLPISCGIKPVSWLSRFNESGRS